MRYNELYQDINYAPYLTTSIYIQSQNIQSFVIFTFEAIWAKYEYEIALHKATLP